MTINTLLITAVFVAVCIINHNVNKGVKLMAATKEDLDAAIAALPAKLEAAIEAAVQPIIDSLKAKGPDLQSEVDQLNGLGDTVSAQVAADLTAANP